MDNNREKTGEMLPVGMWPKRLESLTVDELVRELAGYINYIQSDNFREKCGIQLMPGGGAIPTNEFGQCAVEESEKEKQSMTREEWLKNFDERSMAEIVAELAGYIDSDEFREKCRSHLIEIGAISPKKILLDRSRKRQSD